MKNRGFKFALHFAGFTIVCLLGFVWFLGYTKNHGLPNFFQASTTQHRLDTPNAKVRPMDGSTESVMVSSTDYAGPAYIAPPKEVTKKSDRYAGNTAGEVIKDYATNNSTIGRNAAKKNSSARAIRSWKGVHRDASFAKASYERFGSLVSELSEEHGLYPEVFLARVIAYSYDFVTVPSLDPFDNNFTAMKAPNGSARARFRNAFESLKAYAIVNAGEVTRLSSEGALAKHDRAWTMRKIIDNHGYIKALGKGAGEKIAYKGQIGNANKVSNKKLYEREVVGEAIKMTATVDDVFKNKKAQKEGYNNWDDYVNDMEATDKSDVEKEAAEVITAVSKKKALNLKRRVSAKKKRHKKS